MMNNPFLQRLRERTADWHTRLEQNILSVNLMGPEMKEVDYVKYLTALYGFVTGFEQYIFPELEAFIPDLQKRRKSGKIRSDLTLLGQNTAELDPLPESYFRAMYTDPYGALGALYVLEGSTLGGQLIEKHLAKTLPSSEGKISYLDAYGDETGSMWKAFLQPFCETGEKSGKEENIIDGALRTFRLLDQLMTDESIRSED